MLEWLTNALLKEVDRAVTGFVNSIQRRLLRMALKVFFCIAGLTALALGIIIMGSKYIGLDLMLLVAGVVFVLAFFLS